MPQFWAQLQFARTTDRLTSDAALAALCGVSPVEASSGKTVRHQLNRGDDRQAIAERAGRRAKQQPTLPLGQVGSNEREGRRQHLIQVHIPNLSSTAHTWQSHQAGALSPAAW